MPNKNVETHKPSHKPELVPPGSMPNPEVEEGVTPQPLVVTDDVELVAGPGEDAPDATETTDKITTKH